MKKIIFPLLFIIASLSIYAQDSAENESNLGELPLENIDSDSNDFFYDDLDEKERLPVLKYQSIDERDVFWQKTVWRVVDTREKMNLPFRYPENPFFKIVLDKIKSKAITVYSAEDDNFTTPLCWADIEKMTSTQDTVITFDPETYEEQIQVVTNEINVDDVKKYRIKEMWYFDSQYSTMRVRILGIAPIIGVFDEMGNFRYEKPLFWMYYPHSREALAHHLVFNQGNDASRMTWEDWLEMRFFASYITKESNVYDRRLQDYMSGVDLLQESEKIKQEIFNFEQDLWSY